MKSFLGSLGIVLIAMGIAKLIYALYLQHED